MATKNLSNALTALRTQVRARHGADKQALSIATQAVKEQAPFTQIIQQALIGNKDGKTLSNVTAQWVNQQHKPTD
jgi:Flp pilus assembly protein TadG